MTQGSEHSYSGSCTFYVNRREAPEISHKLLAYMDKNLESDNCLEVLPMGDQTRLCLRSKSLQSNMCLFMINDFMYSHYKGVSYDVEQDIKPINNS